MRTLYLCCYDIRCRRIRTAVLGLIKPLSSGGQRSAYECYLNPQEKQELQLKLAVLAEEGDRIHLQRITQVEGIEVLGRAMAPAPTDFFHFD